MLKTVKSVFVVFILFTGICITAKEKPFIQTKTKRIIADSITATKNGTLTYKASGFSQKIKPKDYLYARIPMPQEIKSASKKIKTKQYKKAVSEFNNAYQKYKFLGWDIFTLFYAAYALEKLGKTELAIEKLQAITQKPKDKKKLSNYFTAKKMEASLCIDSSDFDKAEKILTLIGEAEDPAIFSFVNNARGDILSKQNKGREAVLMYLRTIMLCTKDNKKERPEALKKVIKILKDEQNNRALDFEKILKTDYP